MTENGPQWEAKLIDKNEVQLREKDLKYVWVAYRMNQDMAWRIEKLIDDFGAEYALSPMMKPTPEAIRAIRRAEVYG